MFSGIIRELGQIVASKRHTNGQMKLEISAPTVISELDLGSSIAVNGVCLSVVHKKEESFQVDISPHTLSVSLFAKYEMGQQVNLELAVTPTTRLDGHIVQGHVDGLVQVTDITDDGDCVNITFKIPEQLTRYIAPKGSVAINGISLTIAEYSFTDSKFKVAIIPYTITNTNLKDIEVGDYAHLETDIIARYLDSLSLKRE
ncbi:MAG: riboflavin synthase [SAR324 cluster bacterium]|nr:riboflavin synthase [SAR324 cluster bacterium]